MIFYTFPNCINLRSNYIGYYPMNVTYDKLNILNNCNDLYYLINPEERQKYKKYLSNELGDFNKMHLMKNYYCGLLRLRLYTYYDEEIQTKLLMQSILYGYDRKSRKNANYININDLLKSEFEKAKKNKIEYLNQYNIDKFNYTTNKYDLNSIG